MFNDRQSNLRVVFCTASVGSGHVRAAQAVLNFFNKSELLDVLDYTPKWFNKIYRDGYCYFVEHFPKFVGWCYDKSDSRFAEKKNWFLAKLENFIAKRFVEKVLELNPDVIVSTHFFTSGILSRLRENGKLNIPVVTIVTDDYPHSIWLEPGSDLICVANKSAANVVVQKGIPSHKVMATGIPIDPKFTTRPFNVTKEKPVILVTGGGLGIGDMESIAKYLCDIKDIAKIIVVCGKNEQLFNNLKQIEDKNFQVIGFTNEMHLLMRRADLLICKPGGLTTTEALASSLPMILIKPIPGQEERNAKVLVECGAAIRGPNPEDICHYAKIILENKIRLGRMRTAAYSISIPNSAEIIAHSISVLRN